jgi:hypothetical protein
LLKHLDDFTRFFGLEAGVLEFDAVELYAENEGSRGAGSDFGGNFEDDAGAVRDGTTVLVGAGIRCKGEELGKEKA